MKSFGFAFGIVFLMKQFDGSFEQAGRFFRFALQPRDFRLIKQGTGKSV